MEKRKRKKDCKREKKGVKYKWREGNDKEHVGKGERVTGGM